MKRIRKPMSFHIDATFSTPKNTVFKNGWSSPLPTPCWRFCNIAPKTLNLLASYPSIVMRYMTKVISGFLQIPMCSKKWFLAMNAHYNGSINTLHVISIALLLTIITNNSICSAGTLDIGITSSNYLWMNKFQSDAERTATSFLTIEPYKRYASAIRFYIVPTQRDLYCKRSSTISRLILCDGTIARDIFTQAGYNPDIILVLQNTGTYGGAGGNTVCTSYNGSQMTQVAIHECLGHTFGNLVDEYNLYAGSAAHQDTWYAQCWKGVNPPPIAGTWVKGCNYKNYWRQKVDGKDSVMKSLSYIKFNSRSSELLIAKLEREIGSPPEPLPPADTTAPSVLLTSPSPGSQVLVNTVIEASASDMVGVTKMELRINGWHKSTVNASALRYTWNTSQSAYGTFDIVVTAWDAAGNQSSATMRVTK